HTTRFCPGDGICPARAACSRLPLALQSPVAGRACRDHVPRAGGALHVDQVKLGPVGTGRLHEHATTFHLPGYSSCLPGTHAEITWTTHQQRAPTGLIWPTGSHPSQSWDSVSRPQPVDVQDLQVAGAVRPRTHEHTTNRMSVGEQGKNVLAGET